MGHFIISVGGLYVIIIADTIMQAVGEIMKIILG